MRISQSISPTRVLKWQHSSGVVFTSRVHVKLRHSVTMHTHTKINVSVLSLEAVHDETVQPS